MLACSHWSGMHSCIKHLLNISNSNRRADDGRCWRTLFAIPNGPVAFLLGASFMVCSSSDMEIRNRRLL